MADRAPEGIAVWGAGSGDRVNRQKSTSARAFSVIRRYALNGPDGRTVVCRYRRADAPRSDDAKAVKVVYPDQAAAEAAAEHLYRLCGDDMVAYACHRGAGHWHLATRK